MAAGADRPEHLMHRLPPDPRDVVVEWRVSGGGAPGGAAEPDLVVCADGTATAGGRFGGGRPVRCSLGRERLQDLLRTVLDEHGFFAIDGDALHRALRAAGGPGAEAAAAPDETVAVPLGPPYPDASDTTIAVTADGRRHEVVVHGLAAAAREHPEVPGLADLRAIELELLRLAERIGAGEPPSPGALRPGRRPGAPPGRGRG